MYDSVSTANVTSPETVLVSVVLPAYRCSGSIVQALESVFAQTVTALEVIVVNDGCPDTERLERVLQPYRHRIRYEKQSHQGPSAARNAGMAAAAGKYIAFLDADDYWLPDHLAKQLDLLQRDSSLSLVYSNSLLLHGQEPVATAFGREPQMDSVTFEALITGDCTISTSSVVASRQALLEAGLFDPRFVRCEDYELWMRLAQTGHEIAFSRDVQVCHRLFNGLSSDVKAMREARLEVYERLAADTKLCPRLRQLVVRQIARTKALTQFADAKRLLVSGDYANSRAAAERANAELHRRTLSIFIFFLRTVPTLVRRLYRIYALVVSATKAIQVAILRRKYRVGPQPRAVSGIAAVCTPPQGVAEPQAQRSIQPTPSAHHRISPGAQRLWLLAGEMSASPVTDLPVLDVRCLALPDAAERSSPGSAPVLLICAIIALVALFGSAAYGVLRFLVP